MNPQPLFDAAVIAGMAWFWVRRARPTLLALQAEPRALQLALAATVIGISAMAIHFVAAAAGADGLVANAVRLLGGLVWIIIVGLGYPQYGFLRHATGSKRPGK
jgi:hypothetical protein